MKSRVCGSAGFKYQCHGRWGCRRRGRPATDVIGCREGWERVQGQEERTMMKWRELQSPPDGCWSGRFCFFVCRWLDVGLTVSPVSPAFPPDAPSPSIHLPIATSIFALAMGGGCMQQEDRNSALECHWAGRCQWAAVAERRCAVCMGVCGICGGHPRYLWLYGGVAAGDVPPMPAGRCGWAQPANLRTPPSQWHPAVPHLCSDPGAGGYSCSLQCRADCDGEKVPRTLFEEVRWWCSNLLGCYCIMMYSSLCC